MKSTQTATKEREHRPAATAAGSRPVVARTMVSIFQDRIGALDITVVASGFALVCILASFALLPGGFGWAHVFALCAALALAVVVVRCASADALNAEPSKETLEPERISMLNDVLDDRLEELQDSKWELSESKAHYRELLDAQKDLIVGRNASGEITFVNSAFCEAFGADASELLGSRFAPTVLNDDGSRQPGQFPGPDDGTLSQQVITVDGPRWIQWETHKHCSPNGDVRETQLIGHDVTTQKDTAEKLRRAADLAEDGNRAKSRFLAAMSHEIRTPMNGILGMTSLLRETSQTPEQKTYSDAIEQSAQTLLDLIDEILDFSKVEAGKVSLLNEPFNLEACLQNAVEFLAPRAFEKGLEFAWRVAPDCPSRMTGDESRVQQILLNLLSNAIKFTDEGGVVVTAEPATGRNERQAIQITVTDTGIGMTPEDRDSLFREFEQADEAVRRHSGGTGLGLAISKRLAVAMGGDMIVESEPRKGSTFRLILPALDEREFEARLVEDEDIPQRDLSGRARYASVRRVLIATTREHERKVMRDTLVDQDIDTVACAPAQAIEQIEKAVSQRAPFDRIVIDDTCTQELAPRIFEWARGPEPDVMGLVAVDPIERRHLAAYDAAGFATHLIRPVRPSVLLREIAAPHGATRRNITSPRARPPHADPSRQTKRTTPDIDATAQPTGSLILVAEDNAVNELLATRIIEKAGHRSTTVQTGTAAVAYMRAVLEGGKPAPDLILMDIRMPELDGVGATAQIKALYLKKHGSTRDCPPIVALTANAFDEDRQVYLKNGLDDYLSKPFEAAALVNLLDRWCGDGEEAVSAQNG